MKRLLLPLLLALAVLPAAHAQVVTYSFTGALGSEATRAADAQPTNAVASAFSRGAGLTTNAGANTFAAASFTTAATIDLTDFFQFTVTPNSGFELDLTTLTFDERRSLTGYRTVEVRSSVDNFGAALATITVPDNDLTRPQSVTLPAVAFSNLTTAVTFRIYGYAAEALTGSGRVDNVVLNGAVVAVSGGAETATVTLNPSTATAAEGTTSSVDVVLDIAPDTGAPGLNTAVTGTVVVPGANAGDVSFTGTFTFLAGRLDGDIETISISVVDDVDTEGQEDVPFTFSSVSGGTGSGAFTLTIPANDQPPTVFFSSATYSVTEGTATVDLTVNLTSPNASATTVDVVLTGGSGSSADVGGFTTQTVTFPANSTTAQTVTLTVTDDALLEGPETLTFGLQNATNGGILGTPATATLTITDNEVPPTPNAWINEFHYDNAGADVNEFVEVVIENPGLYNLANFAVVLYNGNGGVTYQTDLLSTFTAGPVVNGFQLFTKDTYTGGIQNGAPDGLALSYFGSVVAAGTSNAQFLSYEGSFLATNGPAINLTSVDVGVAEAGTETAQSLQLTGTGREYNDFTWTGPVAETENAVNAGQTLVLPTVTQTVDDVAGYRLLSAPVLGFTVTDLAEVNLVQGIDAGAPAASFPAQYPGGTQNVVPNVYPEFDGTAYVPAATTGDVLVPGRGFFWQLYDQTITAATLDGFETQFGPGTSESFELGANPTIAATGPVNVSTVTQPFVGAGSVASGFLYMAGNPFAGAMTADGVTGDGPGLNNFAQVYDPVAGFQQLPRDNTTELSTWQGFFVEALAAGNVTITYDAATRTGTNGTLVGRTVVVQGVTLALAGLTAESATTADRALVQVTEAATTGFDADDASKLTPPAGPYALLAAVGVREGAAYRQSVASLPVAEGLVALAFTATNAGTYTLTAESMGLPTGVTAELRDLATGTVVDAASGYTFTSDATDWTGRFELAFRGAVAGENGPTAERTLSAPRPNPATGRAALTLRLPAAERVTATVVDALGRTVATVFDGEAAAGVDVNLSIDAARLAPGVYVIRVQGATFAESRRLTVVR